MRAYKTEIHPTKGQIRKIVQTIGVCRFLYNRYVSHNLNLLKQGKPIVSAFHFAVYVNNELLKEFPWIKQAGNKPRKKALVNAETSFKRYFNKQSGKPKLKKKKRQDVKIYFPKNNKKDLEVERHRIKVPTLGWVRLKEKGFIPTNVEISRCVIEQKADRFYISVLVKNPPEKKKESLNPGGVGIDLGLKDFAVVSDGTTFENINKSLTIKRTEKRLKRSQRALSRKLESKKKRGEKTATNSSNIRKNVLRVRKLSARLARIRAAYRAYVVDMIAKTKPSYITIEKLNVQGMKKNKHLSKAISDQGFFDFKMRLLNRCKRDGIELREVSTFYASSKICSYCGFKKVKLSLSERVFHCETCGHTMDRDLNAAINLTNAKEYVVLT